MLFTATSELEKKKDLLDIAKENAAQMQE